MVTTLENFKQNAEEIIEEAFTYGEPVIIKTGMGNMFLISEDDYRDMVGFVDAQTADAFNNIK